MSSHLYRNLIRVLEKWPLDTSKKGRDLGELVRQKISAAFPQGEATKVVNAEEWNKNLAILERISSDHHKQKYLIQNQFSATGLDAQQCREIVSTSFLEDLHNQK